MKKDDFQAQRDVLKSLAEGGPGSTRWGDRAPQAPGRRSAKIDLPKVAAHLARKGPGLPAQLSRGGKNREEIILRNVLWAGKRNPGPEVLARGVKKAYPNAIITRKAKVRDGSVTSSRVAKQDHNMVAFKFPGKGAGRKTRR